MARWNKVPDPFVPLLDEPLEESVDDDVDMLEQSSDGRFPLINPTLNRKTIVYLPFPVTACAMELSTVIMRSYIFSQWIVLTCIYAMLLKNNIR